MPIYAYRCSTCGHAQDVLRKISDPPLEVCPACGAATFVKQVTAAGFQLKGSGWYVTDFRDSASKKPGKAADGDGATAETNGAASAEAAPTNGTKADAAKPADAAAPTAAKKSEAAPTPAAAPAPAAVPAPDKGKA